MKALLIVALTIVISVAAAPQDLAPRAYVITPVHSSGVVLSYSYYNGKLLFNNVLPITDSSASINVQTLTVYHAFSFFGRSANLNVSLPYGVGTFRGRVTDTQAEAYRSGLTDSVYRLSVNLRGGPAMSLEELRSWRQKLLIGLSIKVIAPTGQYDSTKLINPGSNRWAFKPEVGLSRRWGHWVLDAYTGAWFFTANPKFFSQNEYVSGVYRQTQRPIFSFEGHLSYDVKPRMWVSLDGNYWHGGATSLNGVENPNTVQSNSRVGGTVSVPMTQHQAVKFSYNYGAYIRFGGNYQNIAVAWQYSWVGWPYGSRHK